MAKEPSKSDTHLNPVTDPSHNRRTKVTVVQRYIPAYTIPLFEALAAIETLDLVVLADLRSKSELNRYRPERDGFKAEHLPATDKRGLVFRPGLFKLLSRLSPDVVILSGDPREVSQTLALLWLKLRGIPVGLWSMFHRVGPDRLVTRMYKRFVGRFGDLLLSYAERGRRELRALEIPEDKIMILSTAIDQKKVMAARDSVREEECALFRREMGLEGKRILLHLVRLTAIKRPDIMLSCYQELLKRRDDVLLIWIGGGPLEGDIKESAARLGIADKMRFIGPLYDERVLAMWFKSADVFVMATCIGLSIHHAMCYGVPVVTDDDPLTQSSEFEVLQDGVNGFVYRHGNYADFAEKVSRILDSDTLRQTLSSNAVARIEKEYTLERKVARFHDAIQHLAAISANQAGA
jgi:glycosyltransferase involved in cell wall biosynthesis